MFCANATKVPAFLWLLGAGSQISSTFTDKTQYNTARPAHPTCYSSGKSRKKRNKENKLVRHDTLGKGGWRFVQCLYNTGQAQHTKTHSPYQGKWFNSETEAKKHTTQTNIDPKKRKRTEQSFSYALHYGKEQNYTQVKSKAQIKQLPFQLRQLSTQVVKNPDDH